MSTSRTSVKMLLNSTLCRVPKVRWLTKVVAGVRVLSNDALLIWNNVLDVWHVPLQDDILSTTPGRLP